MTLGDVRIDPARLVPPMATMAPPAPSAPVASGR
jgi:hypothetical protein